MAVFSNFEGTMKKSIQIGKKGLKLISENNELRLVSNDESKLAPLSVGDPTLETHAVTLSYFMTHSSSGVAYIIDTVPPTANIGVNGNIYYQVNATNIVEIYVKHDNIWKPFGPQPKEETSYVTENLISGVDFVNNGDGSFTGTLSNTKHKRGTNIIIQLQNADTGAVYSADVSLSSNGDITIKTNTTPVNTNVVILGETNMSSPYTISVDKSNWVLNSSTSKYELSVLAANHKQSADTLMLALYENVTDGATSSYPLRLSACETNIDRTGDVKFIVNNPVSGKIVISGK